MSGRGTLHPKAKAREIMAYQFAHVLTFSLVGNTKNAGVAGVLGEAVREPKFCPHVENPLPPNILFGMSPSDIEPLLHERIASIKAKSAGGGKGRGIRKDTHVLEGAVFSYPAKVDDLEDPDVYQDYISWRTDMIATAKADAEKRGLDVLSVVEHLDEPHPHIHLLSIPRNERFNAKLCHPGYIAKAAAEKQGNVGAAASKAYREAMSNWQDMIYEQVSMRHGHVRFGPKRLREDRTRYTTRKAATAEISKLIKQIDSLTGQLSNAQKTISVAAKLKSQIADMQTMLAKAKTQHQVLSHQAAEILVGNENAVIKSLTDEIKDLKSRLAKYEPQETLQNRSGSDIAQKPTPSPHSSPKTP